MNACSHVHIQVLSISDCDPIRSQIKLILLNDWELAGSNQIQRKACRLGNWVEACFYKISLSIPVT